MKTTATTVPRMRQEGPMFQIHGMCSCLPICQCTMGLFKNCRRELDGEVGPRLSGGMGSGILHNNASGGYYSTPQYVYAP